MPKFGKMPRPPRMRSGPPVAPTGPKIYHRAAEPLLGFSEFVTPPEGFVTAHTSLTEWMCYLAIAYHTGLPKNPRQPPFIGAPPRWVYQKLEDGGRVPGGSVSDFVVLDERGTAYIGIRVETERFHIWTDGAQQEKDLYINSHLQIVDKVVRVWDQMFIGDQTGEAVMKVMALALKGIEMPSPILMGTAQRVRP
ncbi:MAG: hypothetical protein IT304_09040 [Dehalococcoidia bacterium]|nr:hypothetical protein [Dehalococcoidia bacterium]